MSRKNPDSRSRTFDISDPKMAETVLDMYRESGIFKGRQHTMLTPESASAALEKLSRILAEEGVQSRKWQRGDMYRCYLSAYTKPHIKYIEITPSDGECRLVERSRMSLDSTDIVRVPSAIRKWQQWARDNKPLWDSQSSEAEIQNFQSWLDENDYGVLGAPIESLFPSSSNLSVAQRKQVKDAEFELMMLKIDAEIKEAQADDDGDGIRELEQLRSALAQERRRFLEAADTNTEVPTELLDEVSEMLNSSVEHEDEIEYDPDDDPDDDIDDEYEDEIEYEPDDDIDDEHEGEIVYEPDDDIDDEDEVEYDPENDLDDEDEVEYDPQDDLDVEGEVCPYYPPGFFRTRVIEERKKKEAEYERVILKTRAWAKLLLQGHDIQTYPTASLDAVEWIIRKLEEERQRYFEEWDAGTVFPEDEVLKLTADVFREDPALDALTDEAIDRAPASEDVEAEDAEPSLIEIDDRMDVEFETVEPSVIEVDDRTDAAIDRALESIDIETLENEISQTLKQEMTERGLASFIDTVQVQKVNGDLVVNGVEGYLDNVPLPKGMTPDQQRNFVGAVMAFEAAKEEANAKVLSTVADALGMSAEDEALLAKVDIPQFRIRGSFLTPYTKRELPGEIDQLVEAVQAHLHNVRTEADFFQVRAMIQSLLRYDVTNPSYQKLLDSLVKAANERKLFSENDPRKYLPLIQRTQARARNADPYVPVAENISEGIREEVDSIVKNLEYLTRDNIETYADPDLRQEFLDEGSPEIYFERLHLSGLGACVQEKLAWAPLEPSPPVHALEDVDSELSVPDRVFAYTFEMEFGDLKPADFKRCEDLLNPVSAADNARLEVFAKSVFENVKTVYELHMFETTLEIEIVYGALEGVEFDTGRSGYIKITAPAAFDSSFVKGAYASLCEALALIVKDLEPEIEDDDKDIDGDDLLAEMRVPSLARPNSAAMRSAQQMLTDVLDIYAEKAPPHVRQAYADCLGGLPETWDTGMYVRESEAAAVGRSRRLASELGIPAHIPYDIPLRLADNDLRDIVRFTLRLYANSDGANATQNIFRRDMESALRDVIIPAYFPEKEFRVVLITRDEAVGFIKTHASVFGERDIDSRRLALTLGLEMGGRLVAAATVNLTDSHAELSRVASDGSVFGAAAYLAGAIIDLGIADNFTAYSDFGDTAEAYMALLGKGLRPVGIRKEEGKFQGFVWQTGPEALPASIDIARALSQSYAQDLAKSGISSTELYPKDSHLRRCILDKVNVPKDSSLRGPSLPNRGVAKGLKDLDLLIAYARAHPTRNTKALTEPFEICERLRKNEFLAADRHDVARCAQLISNMPRCTDDVRRKLNELVAKYPS